MRPRGGPGETLVIHDRLAELVDVPSESCPGWARHSWWPLAVSSLSLHFAVFLFFCAPCVFAGAVLDEFMRNLETAMPGAVGWSVWDNMQTQIQNGSQIDQTVLCQLTNQTVDAQQM